MSPQEAAGTRPERARVDIWRHPGWHAFGEEDTDDGFAIDPDDLFAVFEMSATAETVETELKGLLELRAEAAASDELLQNRDERPAVELTERNAQLAEPAAERAKVGKMAQYAALAGQHDKPWWRRLVGWIQTRCAARKRLRERL